MAEEQQEPQQVQRVTTKNPNKVEEGKRLAVHNHRKREELKAKKREEQSGEKGEAQSEASGVNQYYGIGAVLAVGVIGAIGGCLGYYIYRTKQPPHTQPNNHLKQPSPQTNKFEMD